ncbi:hypothetical protein [Variovorax sp. OV329]|uniref:hypothetical protein n=1 Tax=Variovorax sp. OV329 TaxID=1882825 RepID=UPI0008F1E0A3|nr:hypothetical protein [Variovorax sp. OV329]SFN27444.1 hypothetical protein SAMN05444747_12023 [Variovorax sp. OV329]
MFEAFVVIAREAGELLLILLALSHAARRGGRPALMRWAGAGVLAGFAGAWAIVAALPPSGMNEWLDIALTFGFGLSLALVSCGTMASLAGVGERATELLDTWAAHPAAGVAVFAFGAFSALREALEALILIRFISAQEPAHDVALGIVLGLVACGLLALAWRALAAHRGTRWTFRLSAVILFVLGAQMVIEAVVETLVRGVGGQMLVRLGYAMLPYLENGERYWMLCAGLALIPLALWTRVWWRRAGT